MLYGMRNEFVMCIHQVARQSMLCDTFPAKLQGWHLGHLLSNNHLYQRLHLPNFERNCSSNLLQCQTISNGEERETQTRCLLWKHLFRELTRLTSDPMTGVVINQQWSPLTGTRTSQKRAWELGTCWYILARKVIWADGLKMFSRMQNRTLRVYSCLLGSEEDYLETKLV